MYWHAAISGISYCEAFIQSPAIGWDNPTAGSINFG